jgi:hypothetical protein
MKNNLHRSDCTNNIFGVIIITLHNRTLRMHLKSHCRLRQVSSSQFDYVIALYPIIQGGLKFLATESKSMECPTDYTTHITRNIVWIVPTFVKRILFVNR